MAVLKGDHWFEDLPLILRMNYLAHAYLSFNRKDILVGNMISDFCQKAGKNMIILPVFLLYRPLTGI